MEDVVAAPDLEVEVVGMHQVDLLEDLSKASEGEVLTLGEVSNLAGHSS